MFCKNILSLLLVHEVNMSISLRSGSHNHSIYFSFLQWLACRWEYGQSEMISRPLLENLHQLIHFHWIETWANVNSVFLEATVLPRGSEYNAVQLATKPRARGTREGCVLWALGSAAITGLSFTSKRVLRQEQMDIFHHCIIHLW